MKFCDFCNTPLESNACLYCYNNSQALEEFDKEEE
jgi:hypothetical protein